MSSTSPAAIRPFSKIDLIIGLALAAAIGLAWVWLASADMSGMDGHGMAMAVDPWSAGYLVPTVTMWALMMVAMMLPSAAPMILLHARLDRSPAPRARLVNSAAFTLCYLLVWAAASAIAALAQAALVDAGLVSAMTLAIGNRTVTAALLALAGLYQLTAAKRACLDQCRSPIHFVMRYWRPGIAGAVRLGAIHGLYCLGCCWALMLLLFVGGVMNLAWVALLAALVIAEKLAPPAWRLNLVIAASLAIGAIAMLLS